MSIPDLDEREARGIYSSMLFLRLRSLLDCLSSGLNESYCTFAAGDLSDGRINLLSDGGDGV